MSSFLDIPVLASGRAAFAVCVASLWVCAIGTATTANPNSLALTKPAEDFPALDSRHLYALGMIETGNNDDAVGGAGEVSRYQLSPPVWKSYSNSHEYQNPEISEQVARQHWTYLATYFHEKCGRKPTDFDMYVLWNTRYGYYARHGFSKQFVSNIVKDRAERFVNLVNRKET